MLLPAEVNINHQALPVRGGTNRQIVYIDLAMRIAKASHQNCIVQTTVHWPATCRNTRI